MLTMTTIDFSSDPQLLSLGPFSVKRRSKCPGPFFGGRGTGVGDRLSQTCRYAVFDTSQNDSRRPIALNVQLLQSWGRM